MALNSDYRPEKDDRFKRDYRSGSDRRAGLSDTSADGRVDKDRRRAARRHITTERFIPAEVTAVEGMVANPTSAVSCPACEGELMLGPPMERGGIVAWRVECVECHRVALVGAKA